MENEQTKHSEAGTSVVHDPVVSLTQSAADHVRELITKEEDPTGKGLRVFIEKGGCSGMQYGMVFDERRDGDCEFESYGVSVFVDRVSAEFVQGATVDYADTLTDGGFKITNPNARQSCGCGRSFET